MSWIRTSDLVDVPTDKGSAASPWAAMTSLWAALSLDPAGPKALLDLGRWLAQEPSPLSPAQVALMGLTVSATNGSRYCATHEGMRLATILGDEALARAVARDYREANLAARDRVLLDYAVSLTCEPSERKQEDIDRVREYGFDDLAILRATHLAAFVGLLNRLASGLGVELEPGVQAWEFGNQR